MLGAGPEEVDVVLSDMAANATATADRSLADHSAAEAAAHFARECSARAGAFFAKFCKGEPKRAPRRTQARFFERQARQAAGEPQRFRRTLSSCRGFRVAERDTRPVEVRQSAHRHISRLTLSDFVAIRPAFGLRRIRPASSRRRLRSRKKTRLAARLAPQPRGRRRKIHSAHCAVMFQPQRDFNDKRAHGDAGRNRQLLSDGDQGGALLISAGSISA